MYTEIEEWEYLIRKVNTAKKVSTKLAEVSADFAKFISTRMYDLGITTLVTENGYIINVYSREASCGKYDVMYANYDLCGRNGDLLSPKISTDGHYIWGDFNCWVDYPTSNDVLAFIRNAKALLIALNTKIAEIENAYQKYNSGIF